MNGIRGLGLNTNPLMIPGQSFNEHKSVLVAAWAAQSSSSSWSACLDKEDWLSPGFLLSFSHLFIYQFDS